MFDGYPRLLVASFVLLFVSGCATTVNQFYGRPTIPALPIDQWQVEYKAAADPGDQKRARDAIIWEYLGLVDTSYYDFSQRFFTGTSAANLAGDVVAIGISTGASLTPVANVARILAGVAAAVTGVKAAFISDWLSKSSQFVIVQRMDALRAQRLALIAEGMQQATQDYTLDHAFVDLEAYTYAGSIEAALEAIAADSQQQKAAAIVRMKQTDHAAQ